MKKTVKAWAIVDADGVCHGGCCDFGNGHEHFQAVFYCKSEATLAKKLHFGFYEGSSVVPCTITYQLPPRTGKKQ